MVTPFRLLKSALERQTVRITGKAVSAADKKALVEQYGDFSLAYATLTEPYLESFGDGSGMISYAQKMGSTFALGDPLASQSTVNDLINEFIHAFGDPVFVAVRAQTAKRLAEKGYHVNQLGFDSVVDLPDHSFGGGQYKRVRYSTNWLESRNGYVVEEVGKDDAKKIRQISRSWHEKKVTKGEILFLNRRFSPRPEPYVRRFYAFSGDSTLLGFISFDPIFRGGKVIGYLASHKRRVPEDTAYLDLAITRAAIDKFQSEGLQVLNLGLSPLAGIERSGFSSEISWLRSLFQRAHNSNWVNERYFNSRGLAQYKGRFRGEREPLFLCLPPRGSSALKVFSLLILLQVV